MINGRVTNLLLQIGLVVPSVTLNTMLAAARSLPPYRDASASTERRVADLLGRMTPEEKRSPNWKGIQFSIVRQSARSLSGSGHQ